MKEPLTVNCEIRFMLYGVDYKDLTQDVVRARFAQFIADHGGLEAWLATIQWAGVPREQRA